MNLSLTPLVVAVVTFIAFLPVLNNGFVSWDDDRNFLTNPHYRGLGREQLHWMWTTFHLGHYVPLSWMSLGADYLLWGIQPRGYHLTNLLLHALNAALLFFVARALYRIIAPEADRGRVALGAALAALIFAIHPLRVESVAWVTERRDVLSLAFMQLSVLAYLRQARNADKRFAFYALALLAFLCALLSKATVMTLPAVLLILNMYPLRRLASPWFGAKSRRVYYEVAPFALLSAASVLLTIIALDPPAQLGIPQKVAVSAYSLGFYLWKTVAPVNLAALYQLPRTIAAFSAPFLLGYLAVVLFLGLIAISAKRNRAVFTSLLAFLVLALPMLGLVQNGPQIAADRYTYHAAPALALLIGATFLVVGSSSVKVVIAAFTPIVFALGVLTWMQAQSWHDSLTLWNRVAQVDPRSSIAQSSLASLSFARNDLDAAAQQSARAVELDPLSSRAHVAMGIAHTRAGRFADAIAEYERAIALDPLDDQAESNWGTALAQSGNLPGAIQHYQRAIFLNPDNADAHVEWGNALVRQDKPDEAIPHYRDALGIRPDHADAHHNWGVALARMQRYAEAAAQFRAALAINPLHAEAQAYLQKANELAAQKSP